MKRWCPDRGVKQLFSPPHSHKSLELVERFNRTLIDRIRKIRMQRGGSWTDWVAVANEELNTMRHSVIKRSPKELWNLGTDEWHLAVLETQKCRDLNNRRKNARPNDLVEGNVVLLWDSVRAAAKEDKMTPLWKGPYFIRRKITQTSCKSSHWIQICARLDDDRTLSSMLSICKEFGVAGKRDSKGF